MNSRGLVKAFFILATLFFVTETAFASGLAVIEVSHTTKVFREQNSGLEGISTTTFPYYGNINDVIFMAGYPGAQNQSLSKIEDYFYIRLNSADCTSNIRKLRLHAPNGSIIAEANTSTMGFNPGSSCNLYVPQPEQEGEIEVGENITIYLHGKHFLGGNHALVATYADNTARVMGITLRNVASVTP